MFKSRRVSSYYRQTNAVYLHNCNVNWIKHGDRIVPFVSEIKYMQLIATLNQIIVKTVTMYCFQNPRRQKKF